MVAPAFLALAPELGKLAGMLVDRLFPDKEKQAAERAQAEFALFQLQQSGDLQRLSTQMSAILAEAQSPDPWTSRARPSFLYVMYTMILFAIPMGVLSAFRPDLATAIAAGMKAYLGALPEELWVLFGVGYTGYAINRTWEKRKNAVPQ